MGFKFALGTEVLIKDEGRKGFVAGRAEYIEADSEYQIKFDSDEGTVEYEWFTEDQLMEV